MTRAFNAKEPCVADTKETSNRHTNEKPGISGATSDLGVLVVELDLHS
jgi:hypothetical protein